MLNEVKKHAAAETTEYSRLIRTRNLRLYMSPRCRRVKLMENGRIYLIDRRCPLPAAAWKARRSKLSFSACLTPRNNRVHKTKESLIEGRSGWYTRRNMVAIRGREVRKVRAEKRSRIRDFRPMILEMLLNLYNPCWTSALKSYTLSLLSDLASYVPTLLRALFSFSMLLTMFIVNAE